jgi:hypothetical protein
MSLPLKEGPFSEFEGSLKPTSAYWTLLTLSIAHYYCAFKCVEPIIHQMTSE